jgi:hypothetical protein
MYLIGYGKILRFISRSAAIAATPFTAMAQRKPKIFLRDVYGRSQCFEKDKQFSISAGRYG